METMMKPLALVVEDDPHLSQIFMITISEMFETEAVANGTQAIARLSETIPSLVILDINLPGASGMEVLHFIRTDARFASTRVILATADSRKADELEDKADIVLLKPISITQLREFASRLVV